MSDAPTQDPTGNPEADALAPGAPGTSGAPDTNGPNGPGGAGTDAARSWLALLAIVVVVGALVAGAIAVARSSGDKTVQVGGPGGDGKPRRLSLLRGGASAEKATAGAMAPNADAMYYREIQYRLAGELPDLGTSAPVYQLVAPPMDAARVTAMAKAAGISGTATKEGDGWQVNDGSSRALYVGKTPGGWSVSMSGMVMSSSSSAGSSGSGGGSTGAGGSSGALEGSAGAPTGVTAETKVAAKGEDPSVPRNGANVPATAIAPDEVLVDPMPAPSLPAAPANLPDAARAEQLARDLLQAMGVYEGEWVVTVNDGSSAGVAYACPANADCPAPSTKAVVYSRSVQFERKVGGVKVSGLSWSVEVGDGGRIDSLYGTLATPEKVADYPLRSTRSAYDDLVAGKGFFPGPVPMLGAADTPVAVAPMVGSSGGGVAKGVPASDASTALPDVAPQAGTSQAGTSPDGATPNAGSGGGTSSGNGTSTGGTAAPGTTMASGAQTDPGGPSACPKPVPDPSGREPAIACAEPPPVSLPDTSVIEPPVSIAPTMVDVTGAELSASVFPAWEGGVSVSYIVPTYRLLGRFADGSAWSSELLAIDPALVSEVDPSVPGNPTEPGEPPTGPTPTPSGVPGEPPSPVPSPVEPPEPSPPGTNTTTSTVPGAGAATTVYVSNQSFDLTPVDVAVEIDGTELANDSFAVGSQHTFVPFTTTLAPGTHTLTAVSQKGGAKASKTFTVAGPTWVSVFFWTENGAASLQIQVQDTPMAFA